MQKVEVKYTSSIDFPKLNYRTGGTGNALVLLHGFPQSGALWSQVWEGLSNRFRIIIPDLPGAGDSAFLSREMSMEQMADSVKLVLDTENITNAVFAGHSMGGYTALAFAELYPQAVKGLSMVHSVCDADSEEKKENRRKAISLIDKGGKEAFVKQMIPGLFCAGFKEKSKNVIENQIQEACKVPGDNLVAFYNAMINRPDRRKVLKGGHFPVQWIIGKEDSIASPEKVMNQSIVANVNFVNVYDACAHMSMLEQPVELVKDLTYFVKYCYKM